MYREKVGEFYQALVNSEHFSEDLQSKLQRVHDEKEYKVFIQDEILPLAKTMGYDLSMSDIISYRHKKLQSLSEEELESVSGGKGIKNLTTTFIIALALAGSAYAVQVINSAQAVKPTAAVSDEAREGLRSTLLNEKERADQTSTPAFAVASSQDDQSHAAASESMMSGTETSPAASEATDTKTSSTPAAEMLYAVKDGKIEDAKKMIDENADIDVNSVHDKIGRSILHLAVLRGDKALVEKLISRGATVNAVDSYEGATPLHYAASAGDANVVEYLINHGAMVNAVDSHRGATPLHYAARAGDANMVEYLINHGAMVNAADSYGATPLHYAIDLWFPKVKGIEVVRCLAKCLREKGDTVDIANNQGETPLQLAVKNDNIDAVKCLVEDGQANVKVSNKYGSTLLHLAAKDDSIEVARYLVENGYVNVNAKDNEGKTALQVARLMSKVYDYLCEIIKEKQKALLQAVKEGKIDDAKKMIDAGVDVNGAHEEDLSILHWAAKIGDEALVEDLLNHGAKNEAVYGYSKTPLHVAATEGHEIVAGCLIRHGAVIDAKIFGGRTALHMAAEKGHIKVVECLIANNAALDIADDEGQTPLYLAAQNGHIEVVKCLVATKKVDVNAKAKNGDTPLCTAVRAGNEEVIKYLVEEAHAYVTGAYGQKLFHVARDKKFVRPGIYDYISRKVEEKESDELLQAIKGGDLEKAKKMIDAGVDVNKARDEEGRSILYWAVAKGDEGLVTDLLDKGANAMATDKKGEQVLHSAVAAGKVDIVKLMIQKLTGPPPKNCVFAVDIKMHEDLAEACKKELNGLLCLAVYNKNIPMMQVLINNGADVNALTESGDTLLCMAARGGDVEVARCLINNHAIVNEAEWRYQTPLYLAAENGNIAMVKCLVEEGKIKVDKGESPLYVAAEKGHAEVVRYLIKIGAKVGAKDLRRSLRCAAGQGHIDVVKILVEDGHVDVNAADVDAAGSYGETPLHYAARAGRVNVVEYLINKGATLDAENRYIEVHATYAVPCGVEPEILYNSTPLHMAAEKGQLGVVELLIRRGANINIANCYTPLHLAARDGHLNVVQYLVEKGCADLTAKDKKEGSTPLHLAAEKGQLEVVRYLVEKRPDAVDAKNIDGKTPLHLAAKKGQPNVVQYLVEEGHADVNAADSGGKTPLHLAAENGKPKVVMRLVVKGHADVNAADSGGKTPLHLAAENGKPRVAKCLVAKGHADVNAADSGGKTPLHLAAENGKPNVVQYLVEEGHADLTAKTCEGKTPRDLATEKDVIDYLQAAMEHALEEQIHRADHFTDLERLLENVSSDETLSPEKRQELIIEISNKFKSCSLDGVSLQQKEALLRILHMKKLCDDQIVLYFFHPKNQH